jgi:FAD:protein FMN transferase
LHPECMWADVWSTALMVLGMEAGLALANQLRLPAYFIRREDNTYTEHLSRELAALQSMASAR